MSQPRPRRGAAVLGSPIAHSLSPVLHQAAYDVLGLSDWHYRAIDCAVSDLEATLQALDAEGLAGASLTMPLKRAVMRLLTYGGDSALTVGAANTVLFSDTPGQWLGTNTDIPGLVAALEPIGPELAVERRASVLGAGATAASAVAALATIGLAGVDVFARRPAAAQHLTELAGSLGLDVAVHGWDDVAAAVPSALVISTVPADATAALARELHPGLGVLFDVIYSPWPTPLAQAWTAAGGPVVGGLELLVEQAALQVELMTGLVAPTAEMRTAGQAALGRLA